MEQATVIAPQRFDEPLPAAFVKAMRAAKPMNGHHPHPTVADFVLPQVLALTYTAHDMAPFGRDMGYVDAQGQVLPPFVWDEAERRARMAALDAVFSTCMAWMPKTPPICWTPSPSSVSINLVAQRSGWLGYYWGGFRCRCRGRSLGPVVVAIGVSSCNRCRRHREGGGGNARNCSHVENLKS